MNTSRFVFTGVLLAVCAMGCEDGLPGVNETDDTPPIIENFGITFGDFDAGTSTAGDFLFTTGFEKVFVEFGVIVQTPDGTDLQPTFEFRVAPDTVVHAPRGGVIAAVNYQEATDDYEVRLKSKSNSAWTIVLDHLDTPTVNPGDSVDGGLALGRATDFHDGLSKFNLMITKNDGTAKCPIDFLIDGTDLETRITTLIADWEAWMGDTNIHDESQYLRPGCVRTIVELND